MTQIFFNGILYFFGLGDYPLSKPRISSAEEDIRESWSEVGECIQSAINAYGRR